MNGNAERKETLNECRKVFALNRRVFRTCFPAARLLSQSLLVSVNRVCRAKPDSIGVYKLVSDDDVFTSVRRQERGRIDRQPGKNVAGLPMRSTGSLKKLLTVTLCLLVFESVGPLSTTVNSQTAVPFSEPTDQLT